MPKDLSNYRKSYEKQELLESNCPENPMEFIQRLVFKCRCIQGNRRDQCHDYFNNWK